MEICYFFDTTKTGSEQLVDLKITSFHALRLSNTTAIIYGKDGSYFFNNQKINKINLSVNGTYDMSSETACLLSDNNSKCIFTWCITNTSDLKLISLNKKSRGFYSLSSTTGVFIDFSNNGYLFKYK
ncbi:hypothetical protein [Spiroplasma endosymbiont of Nebria brevicollis]|uniref:hypothetical protein n=1 Tax=Spiroplasma endosymbiont of Nebria brevicollis TaxID=3066284 RepID=UPI00313C03D1